MATSCFGGHFAVTPGRLWTLCAVTAVNLSWLDWLIPPQSSKLLWKVTILAYERRLFYTRSKGLWWRWTKIGVNKRADKYWSCPDKAIRESDSRQYVDLKLRFVVMYSLELSHWKVKVGQAGLHLMMWIYILYIYIYILFTLQVLHITTHISYMITHNGHKYALRVTVTFSQTNTHTTLQTTWSLCPIIHKIYFMLPFIFQRSFDDQSSVHFMWFCLINNSTSLRPQMLQARFPLSEI